MSTNWTDPTITSSTHVRAIHVNELRSVVNQNRNAAGLGTFAWTDNPASVNVHIRATHFTELRTAIQDLWNHQGLGSLPNWSSGSAPAGGSARHISARDTTDLRNWVQQYQNATGISYQPVDPIVGQLRGLHLRAGGDTSDMRSQDVTAAQQFNPGMVVVLSNSLLSSSTNLLNYLRSLSPNVEIFGRYAPTTYPPQGYTTFEGYNSWQTGYGLPGAPAQTAMTGSQVAQAIVSAYDQAKANGLTITRWYPGNEPELEWFANPVNSTWLPHTWDDIKYYYRDVYYQLQQIKGSRPIELYPPAFATFASVGIGNYNPDGSVNLYKLSAGGPVLVQQNYLWSPTNPPSYNWQPGDRGFDHVQSLLEYYTNGTPVGRVNWHNYFWPGRQGQQSAYNFLPSWLQAHIVNDRYPARITEYGWIPDCFPPGSCNANLDSTTSPCVPPTRSINSWGDYNDFVRNQAHAGGAAVWLLSSASTDFQHFGALAAVDSSGTIRPWFTNFINDLNP
ncbi:MAG: hypothetical protein ACRDIY_01615 [Chloroflexota bacterium]